MELENDIKLDKVFSDNESLVKLGKALLKKIFESTSSDSKYK